MEISGDPWSGFSFYDEVIENLAMAYIKRIFPSDKEVLVLSDENLDMLPFYDKPCFWKRLCRDKFLLIHGNNVLILASIQAMSLDTAQTITRDAVELYHNVNPKCARKNRFETMKNHALAYVRSIMTNRKPTALGADFFAMLPFYEEPWFGTLLTDNNFMLCFEYDVDDGINPAISSINDGSFTKLEIKRGNDAILLHLHKNPALVPRQKPPAAAGVAVASREDPVSADVHPPEQPATGDAQSHDESFKTGRVDESVSASRQFLTTPIGAGEGAVYADTDSAFLRFGEPPRGLFPEQPARQDGPAGPGASERQPRAGDTVLANLALEYIRRIMCDCTYSRVLTERDFELLPFYPEPWFAKVLFDNNFVLMSRFTSDSGLALFKVKKGSMSHEAAHAFTAAALLHHREQTAEKAAKSSAA